MSSDLSEKEAFGHFEHWLNAAVKDAKEAVTDPRASLRFVTNLKRAEDAARGLAQLRGDATWLTISRGLRTMTELGSDPSRWRMGNLSYYSLADKLDQIGKKVAVKYTSGIRVGI